MRTLPVDVLAGDLVIGAANLTPVDPSMGVVGAVFQPNSAYIPSRHSRSMEDTAPPTELSVRETNGRLLRCAGVDLIDLSSEVGDEGRELHVLGLEDYGRYFDERQL
ncbi:MAG: hypothetical protein Q8N10_11895 [Phenylobacterium sp.]|uniref:hypothetical protein n=1 Tax=Phenylobacterium sp. TaxID=1871053 RepID=UPI002717437D|nr:hypothetical protein [Phenylobacterium sp.]MDO8914253.1 hypothetical protein [Phenylobacterium sp.]MDP3101191.1 hypothetical protein [Phenylobacterium sp.]